MSRKQWVVGSKRWALNSAHYPLPWTNDLLRRLAYCLLPATYCLLLCAPLGAHASTIWTKQQSGTMAWLRSVYFLDENRGWAVGGRGTLLTTSDGGKNWQVQRRPTEDTLRDVYFSNAETGWLVCERSIYLLKTNDELRSYLLKTTDGGATWTRVAATGNDVDVRLVRLIFADNEHGWVFGEAGALYATRDGGASWSRQRVPMPYLLLGGAFLNENQGWLVGAGATILQTSDSGGTWHAVRISDAVADGPTNPRLNAISFADPRHGWTVGAQGLMLATADGGRTWHAQESNVTADLFDVKFFDASEGWAIGAQGTTIHTTDGGQHWSVEPSGTPHPLERLCFVKRTHGWAVGFGGTIIAYTTTAPAPPQMK